MNYELLSNNYIFTCIYVYYIIYLHIFMVIILFIYIYLYFSVIYLHICSGCPSSYCG